MLPVGTEPLGVTSPPPHAADAHNHYCIWFPQQGCLGDSLPLGWFCHLLAERGVWARTTWPASPAMAPQLPTSMPLSSTLGGGSSLTGFLWRRIRVFPWRRQNDSLSQPNTNAQLHIQGCFCGYLSSGMFGVGGGGSGGCVYIFAFSRAQIFRSYWGEGLWEAQSFLPSFSGRGLRRGTEEVHRKHRFVSPRLPGCLSLGPRCPPSPFLSRD